MRVPCETANDDGPARWLVSVKSAVACPCPGASAGGKDIARIRLEPSEGRRAQGLSAAAGPAPPVPIAGGRPTGTFSRSSTAAATCRRWWPKASRQRGTRRRPVGLAWRYTPGADGVPNLADRAEAPDEPSKPMTESPENQGNIRTDRGGGAGWRLGAITRWKDDRLTLG